MNLQELLDPVVQLAKQAGDAILEVYATDFDVETKNDASPLTRADMASHLVIEKGLAQLTPDIPIISEESGLPRFEERRQWQQYWLIDPLDGTKEFVKRNGEFTVNIALIDGNRPLMGVVHVPVLGKTYTGCEIIGAAIRENDGATRQIKVAEVTANPVRIVGSRSHRGHSLDALITQLGGAEILPMGSSLKFCVIAEGGADIYPRLGPTSEWDTAAAQAVVEQAGGKVLKLDGSPLTYNTKRDILNPYFLVAGPMDREWLSLLQA